MAHHRKSNGDLPWGWWLKATSSGFVDEDGRTWGSVREAFWEGRLCFPSGHVAKEQHELLLRVLTFRDRAHGSWVEGNYELFEGHMLFWRFYMCWLVSVGLVQVANHAHATALEAGLTDEGRSVMRMLQATRDPDWAEPPMSEVLHAVRAYGRGAASAAREAALVSFEAEAVHLPWVFARERVGRAFTVTLTGIATDSRMPTRRVVWTQSFADDVARDDFFDWLAERVERWEEWGGIAYRRGAHDLTQHLLALVVAGGGALPCGPGN